MLNENNRRKYSPIDPYMSQSIVKDFTDENYDETEKEEVQIKDYSQFDYEKFRDKRQINSNSPDYTLDQDRVLDSEIPLKDTEEVKEYFLTPLYIITGVFAAMLIIGPLLVTKGPHRGIVQSSIMLTAFCMWIFWFTIYFGQMNPLMGPRLENTTVAWIAYKLGNQVGNSSEKPESD